MLTALAVCSEKRPDRLLLVVRVAAYQRLERLIDARNRLADLVRAGCWADDRATSIGRISAAHDVAGFLESVDHTSDRTRGQAGALGQTPRREARLVKDDLEGAQVRDVQAQAFGQGLFVGSATQGLTNSDRIVHDADILATKIFRSANMVLANDSPAIAARGLVKTYGKNVRALDGLDLTVAQGDIHALLGPNGAGKSTTVKIVTTLSKPDGGTAEVMGNDVVRDADKVRRLIGVVGQNGAVDPEATGRENMLLQGAMYGMSGKQLRVRVDELLSAFGLAEPANRIVKTWSGGQKRKLDVATGLVHQPRVLFLDEPTTGLDPEARSELWAEVRRLNADGLTILLTTHYLEEADQLAGQVAIIDRGRIVAGGAPDELKRALHGDFDRARACGRKRGRAQRSPVRRARPCRRGQQPRR